MFLDAYAKTVGNGAEQSDIGFDELERRMRGETLATGLFQEPFDPPLPDALVSRYPVLETLGNAAARRALWSIYASASCADRAGLIKTATGSEAITIVEMEALPAIFGQSIAHDGHSLPAIDHDAVMASLAAPALMVTGWYDWGLVDALATFQAMQHCSGRAPLRDSRLIVTPSAHNTPGYHEGADAHPALRHNFRTSTIVPLIDAWCNAVSTRTSADWPRVLYYLMGADEWREAGAWPPEDSRSHRLYLHEGGALGLDPPGKRQAADSYIYRPDEPTPTLGGSIVSSVTTPGSVDIAELHERDDVLVYTSPVLVGDLDIVGPLRAVIYVSSSAIDTDFAVRLSDVNPDGRAIQIQNGVLRARYRDGLDRPAPLEPGRTYRLEIDMWATAMRFAAGHRLRVDIASADFPRFDRHANRADPGPPLPARQRVFRDAARPSHIVLPVIGSDPEHAFGIRGDDKAAHPITGQRR
jgi:putative CocE/NonD family hydrolase